MLKRTLVQITKTFLRQTPQFNYSQLSSVKLYGMMIQRKQLNFVSKFNFANFDEIMSAKKEISEVLKTVKLSDGQDIIARNLVQDILIGDNGEVTLEVSHDKDFKQAKKLCMNALKQIPWITKTTIKMAVEDEEEEQPATQKNGLAKVKKIIAVSSCKGGVGKSTVAVNLAFSLQKLGLKIGIFDADIYGPSLPTLINKEDAMMYANKEKPDEIVPIEIDGVKTMSFGYNAQKKAATLRGPIVSSIVSQLITKTAWGDLDYLVVDFPPGTGDIQITLCQDVKFDGSVIVTTPQKLSFIDVVKGIEMFDKLKVPTVSVVENMASFICDNCKHVHYPFGPGYVNMLKSQFGIKNSFQIPLYSPIAMYSDTGKPVVNAIPENHIVNQTYRKIAENVHQEIQNFKFEKPTMKFVSKDKQILIEKNGQVVKKISPLVLRGKCHCALCKDEFTGEKLLKPDKIDKGIFPTKIESKGNYAVQVNWSDGHSSIYPHERLLSNEFEDLKE